MRQEKKWEYKPYDQAIVDTIYKDLNINRSICHLLSQRGVTNYETAKNFFRPELTHLHSPFLMKDMEKAVKRIQQAADDGEKIMIFGDYDVDGTTSVAVVYDFLQKNLPNHYNDQLCFYIPHRYNEGYGLSFAAIDKCSANDIKLLVTLDCGIKSVDKIALAAEKGIDVIVCDHHLPGTDLPQAVAILNPKQEDCSYPYKELSGCGIGYKLISALAEAWDLDMETVYYYLDLVATSIAADIVPITNENRVLTFHGLQRLNKKPSLAIRTIKEIAGVERPLDISDLVFIIAPRINAAGRMDDANKVVSFFIEEDPAVAKQMAEMLHSDNTERKEVDKSISDEALGLLQNDKSNDDRLSTVLYQSHWHKGVVGIVASRLIDHYYRPTIVLTESNGKITGSARSVVGFNIHDAIYECRDLLDNFGGHFFAAGLTMPMENLEAFKERFEEVVRNSITDKSREPVLLIDAEINLGVIQYKFFNIIKQFEPYGPENLRPVFCSKNVINYRNNCRIVKEQHIRFHVCHENSNAITGIGFNLAHKFDIINQNKPFDMVFTIDENEWHGNKNLQIIVLDIRQSA